MKPLTPVDRTRCQAETKEEVSAKTFMRIGWTPTWVRCENKPVVIVTEAKPDKDGQHGAMSLCDECHKQFEKKFPPGYVDYEWIRAKRKKGK